VIGDQNDIDYQRLQIAINSRTGGSSDETRGRRTLPYDPSAPPDDTSTTVVLAQNSLDNSDFDYSKLDYTGAGAGDDAYECYNFYRQRFIKEIDVVTTAASNVVTSASSPFKSTYTYPMDFVLLNGGASGVALVGYINRNGADNSAKLFSDVGLTTPLNVTPTLAAAVLWFGTSLAENSTNALKSSAHSTFAANEGTNTIIPRWMRTEGWVELGSNAADHFDIATPLPINFVRAGLTLWFRCIVSQRSGTSGTGPVRVSAGIWDATTARQRFLESSNLDLSAAAVGTTGATSYDYVVLADLDDGRTIVSDTATVANGNASLSTSNYNRLTWQNASGVIRFRIYRKVGGVTKRIFTITNGNHDYNDYGSDEGETPASLPTAGEQRPIAYAVSGQFDPEEIGDGTWMTVLIAISVPETYDSSTTTGKQWLRFQIEGNTHDERMVLLDRVSLSTSNGGWNRSARDLNRIATGNPSSQPPDGGGQGDGGIGDGGCFVLKTPIVRCDQNGENQREVEIGSITLEDVSRGYYVFAANRVRRVRRFRDSQTKTLVHCILSNGVGWTCSMSQKFVTASSDLRGTRIDALTLGDTVQGWDRDRVTSERIVFYEFEDLDEPSMVRTLSLAGGKTFIAGSLTGWRSTVERLRNRIRKAFGLEPEFTKAVGHNEKPLIFNQT
jgi:hypothetical protein